MIKLLLIAAAAATAAATTAAAGTHTLGKISFFRKRARRDTPAEIMEEPREMIYGEGCDDPSAKSYGMDYMYV